MLRVSADLCAGGGVCEGKPGIHLAWLDPFPQAGNDLFTLRCEAGDRKIPPPTGS